MAFKGYVYSQARCVNVAPNPVDVGDDCFMELGSLGGIDNCDEDSFCYHYDATADVGVCTPFCAGTPAQPTCPAQRVCGYDIEGTLALCRDICDPLAQDCPHPGSACRDVNDGVSFGCYVDANGDEEEPKDDLLACSIVNGCQAGSVCVPEERARNGAGSSPFVCTRYCDTTDPEMCPLPEQSCTMWIPGAVGEPARIGACLAP